MRSHFPPHLIAYLNCDCCNGDLWGGRSELGSKDGVCVT